MTSARTTSSSSERLSIGTKVSHEGRNDNGTIVGVISPTYRSVQWHGGDLHDEHIADLSPAEEEA